MKKLVIICLLILLIACSKDIYIPCPGEPGENTEIKKIMNVEDQEYILKETKKNQKITILNKENREINNKKNKEMLSIYNKDCNLIEKYVVEPVRSKKVRNPIKKYVFYYKDDELEKYETFSLKNFTRGPLNELIFNKQNQTLIEDAKYTYDKFYNLIKIVYTTHYAFNQTGKIIEEKITNSSFRRIFKPKDGKETADLVNNKLEIILP